MSTRSLIAKKEKEGYRAIYCHFDGYIEGVGDTLNRYYLDENRVTDLINLGDLSSLGQYIVPAPNGVHHNFCMVGGEFKMVDSYSDEHSFDSPQENVCVAYHRDRGEKLRVSTHSSLKDLKDYYKDTWCEYLYIYDNGIWYYYGLDVDCDPKILKDELAKVEKKND